MSIDAQKERNKCDENCMCNACRQRRFRQSEQGRAAAQRRNALLKEARANRKIAFYKRKTRDKALGTFRGYGGPAVPGVPQRVTMLRLKNYYPEAVAREVC